MNFEDFCEKSVSQSVSVESDRFKKFNDNLQKNNKKQQKNGQNQQIFDNLQNLSEQDIKNNFDEETLKKISQYQKMDKNELLNTLIAESKKQKQNGNLDNKKLAEIESTMLPFLSDNEKATFKNLIDMIKWVFYDG